MEEINDQISLNVEQIKKMEKFIALSMRRESISSDYTPLAEDMLKVRKVMLAAYQQLNDELEQLENEQDKLMRRMRQQQAMIMNHLLNQKKRNEQKEINVDEEKDVERDVAKSTKNHTASGSAYKTMTEKFLKLHMTKDCTTPKFTISEYKQSPLVLRPRPIPFSFLEFEVELTPKLFDSIPKYMRGRESIAELTDFLENVIIPCYNDKYKLQHRQRSTVRNRQELELWKLYNEQAAYLPGKFFITPGDITRKIEKMLDKKLQNRITMLRHIGFLQEQRVSQTVCYIWSANMK